MNIQVSSEGGGYKKMKRTADATPTATPSKIRPWADPVDRTPEKSRGPPLILKASPTKQIRKRNAREPIQTYVFFDLECTGLIRDGAAIRPRLVDTGEEYYEQLEQKCLQTRADELPYITEMSFVAISRDTFDEHKQQRVELVKWNEENPTKKKELAEFIPTNTHTRQLDPGMNDNEWIDYDQKRRGRERVLAHARRQAERNNKFDVEWPAVVDFLLSLKKPALLIGHNALDYDLRIIYGEMGRYGLKEQYPVPDGVFFIDSLLMARQVEMNIEKQLVTVCKYIKFPKIPAKEDADEERITIEDSSLDSTKSQDIPPIREPTIVNGVLARDHPANILNHDQFPVVLRRRIHNEGFIRTATGGWTYRQNKQNRCGLVQLYEELVGGKYNAHFAQPDAEALMHVCLSYGDEFSQFGDTLAAPIPF